MMPKLKPRRDSSDMRRDGVRRSRADKGLVMVVSRGVTRMNSRAAVSFREMLRECVYRSGYTVAMVDG